MLPLDVPFVPEGDYPEFLAERRERLSSVHFSLYDTALADARQRTESHAQEQLIAGLNTLGDTPKYVLLNTRLHAPEAYFDADRIATTADRLVRLRDQAGLTGLIFADPYYLQALSDAHPEIAESLEAVPSINCQPDSPERVFALLDMIGGTAFKLPTKLVLDRTLNRDMARLEATTALIKEKYPAINLHLMANEGCLLACPYKPAHDGHVALVVEGLCGDRTFAMNREFGCVRRFLHEPGSFLASPFIRPEDAGGYGHAIDGLKLCGRNRGIPFLKRVITAYLDGAYPGNVLDLMDAMGDLSDRVHLSGSSIPDNFLKQVTTCDKACRPCGWCSALAEKVITRMDPGLERL